MSVGLVLVGGHESDSGRDLHRLQAALPGCAVTGVGRALESTVRTSLDGHDATVVVPMTFGRDPALVTETATTLRWLAGKQHGRVALAAPFGTPDHLVSRLRAAADAIARDDPDAAIVVHAASHDPFDDAELHRIAHLVRVHGAGLEVAVAATSCAADLAPVVARLRVLGFPRAVVVPAGLATGLGGIDLAAPAFTGVTFHGPVMSDAAIARIAGERADTALHALDHGDDGIDRALGAAHDHGFTHTHTHAGEHDHPHPHGDGPAHAGDGTDHHPPRYPTWRAASPATTTEATTSRSTPAAPR